MYYSNLRTFFDKAFEELVILKLPAASFIQEELTHSLTLLSRKRPPRILVVNQSGADREGIIGALIDNPTALSVSNSNSTCNGKWRRVVNRLWELDLFFSSYSNNLKSTLKELTGDFPDIILGIIDSSQHNQNIDSLKNCLQGVQQYYKKRINKLIPIIIIAYKVDKPYADTKKELSYSNDPLQSISAYINDLKHLFSEAVTVVPIASHPSNRYDLWYNFDIFVEVMASSVPVHAQVSILRTEKARHIRLMYLKKYTKTLELIRVIVSQQPCFKDRHLLEASLYLLLILYIREISGSTRTITKFIGALGLTEKKDLTFEEVLASLSKLRYDNRFSCVSFERLASAFYIYNTDGPDIFSLIQHDFHREEISPFKAKKRHGFLAF